MVEIKNKLLKFTLNLIGFLSLIVLMLGMKIKNDADRKAIYKANLLSNELEESNYTIQNEIKKAREKALSQIMNSPGKMLTTDVTTTTNTPKPVVVEKKADKQTRSS